MSPPPVQLHRQRCGVGLITGSPFESELGLVGSMPERLASDNGVSERKPIPRPQSLHRKDCPDPPQVLAAGDKRDDARPKVD